MTTALAPAKPEQITVPGVYDIPADEYHADPVPGGSLSASGARKLLPPSCPALYRHELDNPPEPRKVFELGHAAHALVLGTGPELVLIERETWNTNEVKAQVANVRERGGVPLKPSDYETVHAMADALRAHPTASALFAPGSGKAEQSLFWIDTYSDGSDPVWRRARLDWLPNANDGRMIVPDYKTARSAAPDDLPRVMDELGYHRSAAWYMDGVLALGLASAAAFVLVVQEKTAPYLVTVAEPNAAALRVGRLLNAEALAVYRECRATGVWPGYADEVVSLALPPWVEARHMQEIW